MGLRRRDFKIKKQEYTLSWQINDRRRRRYDSRGPYRLSQSRLLAHHECKAPPGVGEVGNLIFESCPGWICSVRHACTTKTKSPPRSPLRSGFLACRLLTLLPGRPKLFHRIDVGSPPAL